MVAVVVGYFKKKHSIQTYSTMFSIGSEKKEACFLKGTKETERERKLFENNACTSFNK